MPNPFNYLRFATGDQFHDRREIRKDFLSRFLSDRSIVVLYGPRRYGKSSLVGELIGDLEKVGIPCVTLDQTGFDDAYRRRYSLGVSSMVNSAKAKLMEDGHIE